MPKMEIPSEFGTKWGYDRSSVACPPRAVTRREFCAPQHNMITQLNGCGTADVASQQKGGVVSVRSYGVLSTFPPTQCGLATFTESLVGALAAPTEINAGPDDSGRNTATVGVVGVVDSPDLLAPPPVVYQWVRSDRHGAAATAAVLNRFDVAIIQHEYGIYGGPDGADVLEVVRALRVPVIAVLHTVLTDPTFRQRIIVEELARHCSALVTMTETGRHRLIEYYAVGQADIVVIPHGAAEHRFGLHETWRQPVSHTPVVLTWGLLGEGKGIEWGIDAMAHLADLRPTVHYQVVGQTHPKVRARHGESYRAGLVNRTLVRGVADTVHFDARYLTASELRRLIDQAAVVLLPYDSREQVTSGVLIEAVAAGKPVVSTDFPHARELLSSGAGLLVDRKSPRSIAVALRRVLTEHGLAAGMSAEAKRLAPELFWSAVGKKYHALAAATLRVDAKLAAG
ncbi:glycosyltransferase [Nocardia brasiliensis]|uniref:glycosyltransferase n=1 Tax=Nocardia brasiliensis TaxID=37326 RepID=UPI0033FA863B